MKLTRILSSTAVAAALLFTGAANAEVFQFNVTGDYTASWTIDTDTVPDSVAEGEGFTYWGVAGTFAGTAVGTVDVSFYSSLGGGGVNVYDYINDVNLLDATGAQLYTGIEGSATFVAGTYSLTEYEGTGNYTLTISAVPEPATYGMVLAGVGLVGLALRRRQGK